MIFFLVSVIIVFGALIMLLPDQSGRDPDDD